MSPRPTGRRHRSEPEPDAPGALGDRGGPAGGGGLLAWLVLLYSPRFRRRYGRDLLDQLRRDLADARSDGGVRSMAERVRYLADFVVSGVRERGAHLLASGLGRVRFRDVRHAFRGLRRRPGFTIAAVTILGLGLAVNVSVLSLGLGILRPRIAEVADAHRLMSVFQYNTEQGYFRVLGVEAELGRSFDPAGDESEARSAVVSHAFWGRHLGGRPDTLGSAIRIGEGTFTVIGVAPEGFRGLELDQPVDVWLGLDARGAVTSYREEMVQTRGMHWLEAVGRLTPGATPEQLGEAARAVAAVLADEFPGSQAGWEARVLPLTEAVIWPGQRAEVRRVILTLTAVVLLILLLTCVTLASMALADALGRRGEAAVRLALGAGRGDLVREQIVRALLITLPALALGLLAGDLVVQAVTAWGLVPDLPPGLDFRPDDRVVTIVVLIGPVLVLLVGILPALHAGSEGPGLALASRGSASGSRVGRLRRVLSVLQVAISVAVLAVAGSLTRSAMAQLSHDLGFEPEGVLLASVDLSKSGYDAEEQKAFIGRAREVLAELPGVRSAAAAAFVPLSRLRLGANVTWTDPGGDAQTMNVTGNIVSPDYFRTMGIPVLAGREHDDEAGTESVPVLVNRAGARRFWGDESAVGRQLDLGSWLGGEATVVGVVEDLGAGRAFFTETPPSVFLSLQSNPWGSVTFHVRADDRPLPTLVADVRRTLSALDREVPVYDVRTLESDVEAALAPAVAAAGTVGMLGFLGLLLAAAGIYGVVAQAVTRRRREFGIRVAVGAAKAHVVGYVLREGGVMFLAGVVLGVPGALALSRLMEGRLFGVRASDPLTLVGAVLVTGLATAAALALPARRATSVDPSEALRNE